MFKNLLDIDLRNLGTAIPLSCNNCYESHLLIVFSIGLAFGFVSYVLIKVFVGKAREVNLILWIVAPTPFLRNYRINESVSRKIILA